MSRPTSPPLKPSGVARTAADSEHRCLSSVRTKESPDGRLAPVPLYEVSGNLLSAVPSTTYAALGLLERKDLQRYLKGDVSIIADDVLVVSEEFGDWEDARRRIDLLGVDRSGRLVVIELKRTEDGGHLELQALRYAAMVSTMTFEQLADTYKRCLLTTEPNLPEGTAEDRLREHLDTDEPVLSRDVRIILVSADFGREITTTVLWLNEVHGMDIVCIRLVPYAPPDRTGAHRRSAGDPTAGGGGVPSQDSAP